MPKFCGLCGIELVQDARMYHPDCRRELANLKRKMRARKNKNHNEIEYRFDQVKENVEWILQQPNRNTRSAIGQAGEDIIIRASIQLRKQ